MTQCKVVQYQDNKEMPKQSKDLYNTYLTMSSSPVLFKKYKEILQEFNIMIMEALVAGAEFNMGYNLSNLSIIRANVNPNTARIDWNTSMKFKEELLKKGTALFDKETGKGEKWFIYHTSKQYFKFYWSKMFCRVKNSSVYRFDATRGKKGNKQKLKDLINNDDLAYLRFKRHGNL